MGIHDPLFTRLDRSEQRLRYTYIQLYFPEFVRQWFDINDLQ